MLSACNSAPIIKERPRTPPIVYTVQTPEPIMIGRLNRDMAQYVLDLQHSLRQCNADKSAITQWSLTILGE